jgi:glycerol-3-phosphate dehydrogenase (NAD(P)+)
MHAAEVNPFMSDAKVFERIGVIGAGAWGTALANVAARAGRETILWARDPAHAQEMARDRANARRLPGVALHERVRPTSCKEDLAQADAILLVTPAQSLRAVAQAFAPLLPAQAPIAICAKGVERGTHLLMGETLAQAAPGRIVAALSGPSFAHDVAAGLPTAVTLACEDEAVARVFCTSLAAPGFRLYHTTDLRGVEIGGAAKNVLAIACGVAAGRGLGASAQAALVARGFAELRRFGRAMGAREETLMGLSGLGDLVLTCGSLQSRNFALGHALGRGEPAPGALAEGAFTAAALVELARARGVDMPICAAVDAILADRMSVSDAVEALLARPLKSEV